jgi:hypothetical protein
LRLEKALTDLLQDRAELTARQLTDALENGLRFGIPLNDQADTPRKMASLASLDNELLGLTLFDAHSQLVFQHPNNGSSVTTVEQNTLARILKPNDGVGKIAQRRFWTDRYGVHILMQVRDATGAVAGAVWVRYDGRAPRAAYSDNIWQLTGWSVALSALITVLLAGLMVTLRRRGARTLDALEQGSADSSPGWPYLPAPQTMRKLTQLEHELDEMATTLSKKGPP